MYYLGSLSLKEKTTMLLAAMYLRVFWSARIAFETIESATMKVEDAVG
jgi:hypothetical protein